MSITFSSDRALEIYSQVMARVVPGANEYDKAEKLFHSASWQGELDEKGASEVEALLNRYDQQQLCSLQIQDISLDEIELALEEQTAWENCFTRPNNEEAADLFRAFIAQFPLSDKLPNAYYLLGEHYEDQYEVIKAIAAYNQLVQFYPATTEASEALQHLVDLSNQIGEKDKALAYAKEWLKLKPYQPFGHYGPAPSYAQVKTRLQLKMANVYYQQGKRVLAADIYNEITRGEIEYDSLVAAGALTDLQGKSRQGLIDSTEASNWYKFLWMKRSDLYKQAEYFHYDRHDYARASRIYWEIQKINKQLPSDLREKKADMALIEISLRRAKALADRLKIYEALKKEGKVEGFLRYKHGGHLPSDKLPPETALLAYLLSSSQEVKDVRLLSYFDVVAVNQEVKTPRQCYLLIYRIGDKWKFAGGEGACDPQILGLTQKELTRLANNKDFVLSSGKSISQRPFISNLFDHSLGEFYGSGKFRFISHLVFQLENERLPADTQNVVRSLSHLMGGNTTAKEKLDELVNAYVRIPPALLSGLLRITFEPEKINACGTYFSGTINLACSGKEVFVHEIGHHWDLGIARGGRRLDRAAGDPSLVYYRISWERWSGMANGSTYIEQCVPQGQANACAEKFQPVGWQKKETAALGDFARNYGLADGIEDLATGVESYFTQSDNLSRRTVRQQMTGGHFKTALKYLFIKHLVFFDPRDGLSYEYNLSLADPPITFDEVRQQMMARNLSDDLVLLQEIEGLHKGNLAKVK